MAACNPGQNYEEDASDYTICPWDTNTGYCVFLNHPVPITDVYRAQKCVHLDYTQGAITKCEKATSDKAFFSLEFTDFGHPMHDGVFPCCTNAAELLKRQVGMLPLRDAQDKEVEETSALTLSTLFLRLTPHRMQNVLRQYWTGLWSGTRTSWFSQGLKRRKISNKS